ncbi:crossover junction endodeoxyribonuclease RuvC [Rhodoflexus caldus]|uniref:crossover junction endodeoxyribonuclease RuvC n=1 Tax=Rhodoflexus caldus TaxID=2891236 RepID=UPI00202A7E0B|nr:crossover junction endodeoxyribonuclease RuvC [Rhodoflexus caldus]
MNQSERIIIGLDPGTVVMGYGIVKMTGRKLEALQMGVIHLSKYDNHAQKLQKIWERVHQLVEQYMPDEMALEAPFYGKNIQSMLKLGRAQGVAMAVALARGIPIIEYAPKKVKQAVTGNGSASKEQVAAMLQSQLAIGELPELLDATDALAVAVCHAYQQQTPARGKAKNWAAFIADNPDRVKKS